jgi:hypothetical protein
MDGYKGRDPQLAIVVSAVKATVKGGLGKLRERPRGEGWRPGEPWRALSRPTWLLDFLHPPGTAEQATAGDEGDPGVVTHAVTPTHT